MNNEKVLRTESVLSFSFIITKLGEDYIEIKTNTPMSSGFESINLNSKETNFKIEKDKKLRLTTLSFDFGYIYTFELK